MRNVSGKIAAAVIAALEDRKGFDEWWHDIHPDDQADILTELTAVVDVELDGGIE